MASELVNAFLDPSAVDIVPLMAEPRSTDPSSFVVPTWDGFQPNREVLAVEPTGLPGGLTFSVQTTFRASSGVWQVVGFAATRRGLLLFYAALPDQAFITAGTPVTFSIRGQLNPVQA